MILRGFIVILLLFTSCTEGIPRVEEPENLIPQDKMILVLTDMSKLEGHIQIEYTSVDQYHKVMVNSGDSLLKSYGLDQATYEASMNYYGSRQQEMMDIYTEVLENLNQELGELETQEE